MIVNAVSTVCCWLRRSLIIPSAVDLGTSPADQAKPVKIVRPAGRCIFDRLGLARSLAGGSTADGMISTTAVRGNARDWAYA